MVKLTALLLRSRRAIAMF